eukprot:6179559-Pleurochrysis_carterae.AAC.5
MFGAFQYVLRRSSVAFLLICSRDLPGSPVLRESSGPALYVAVVLRPQNSNLPEHAYEGGELFQRLLPETTAQSYALLLLAADPVAQT